MAIGVDAISALRAKKLLESKDAVHAAAEKTIGVSVKLLRGISRDEFEAVINDAFKKFDENGDAKLSTDELEQFLKSLSLNDTKLTSREIRGVMLSADTDGSGFIEFGEFSKMMFEYLRYAARRPTPPCK